MQDGTDSIEDRISQKRARRWKRRGRIAAPFVAVPATFLLLVVSIDLIEYQPAPEKRSAASVARPTTPTSVAPALRPMPSARPGDTRSPHDDVHSISVAQPTFSASASLSEPVIGRGGAHAYGDAAAPAPGLRSAPVDSSFGNAR